MLPWAGHVILPSQLLSSRYYRSVPLCALVNFGFKMMKSDSVIKNTSCSSKATGWNSQHLLDDSQL